MKNRLARVCEVIKRELGLLIPRQIEFGGALVTVSGVDITPDLKQAHVLISVLGGGPGARRRAMELLDAHRAELQSGIASHIKMKNTPHLHFRLDESVERGSRIIGIMDELGLLEEKQ